MSTPTPRTDEKPKRFNWRGNRPRVGKRAICPACATIFRFEVGKIAPLCGICGEAFLEDVSHDDGKESK